MDPKILQRTEPIETTIQSLFLDYDGTISPPNVSRISSKVPEETAAVLKQISNKIPVAIVTSKDPWFVVPKTPFATAWATIGGLETIIGTKILETQIPIFNLECISIALKHAKTDVSGIGLDIEEKRNSHGQTAGFCVDWRRSEDPKLAKRKADFLASRFEELPLQVVRFDGEPFFDVYPLRVDKGASVQAILLELGLEGGIMFMGNSEMDNPAFQVSDVSLGVTHDQASVKGLECDYFMKFEEVAAFLRELLENNLSFSSSFSSIKPNPRDDAE